MSLQIRAVNGWGARCGCGGMSVLHCTTHLGKVTPQTSRFLCRDCVQRAILAFVVEHPEQPAYWPGDEDRDEPYAPPERDAA